tara:strand:+ start:919 stop:1875 length:957 start_codon:yes stop_codon:yes gene_type:complete
MNEEKGFTLIETSILIIMISLILVPLYGYMTQIRLEDKIIEEEAQMEVISAAIAKYVRENNKYPCPARLNSNRGVSNNYGEENCTPSAIPGVMRGALPTQELELSQSYASNQYGWKHLYYVGSSETNAGTYNDANSLTINFEGGGNTESSFIVINVGADGKGSNNENGVAGPVCGSTAIDSENCDDDTDFSDATTAKLSNINDSGYFDDKLAYSTAREDTTHWKSSKSSPSDGNVHISIRKAGGVSIGTETSGAPVDPGSYKLMVKGGNVRINGDTTTTNPTGELKVNQKVVSDRDVQTTGGNLNADTEVRSELFYYE